MRVNQNDAPPSNLSIKVPTFVEASTGNKRRNLSVYKKRPNVRSILPANDQLFIIFKMATIEINVTEQIPSKVNLFKSIMQQNVIENQLNCKYAPHAIIKPSITIEFTVKGANDLYLDLNNAPACARHNHQNE